MKHCLDCGLPKPLDEFPSYRNTSGEKRHRNVCKKCHYASLKANTERYTRWLAYARSWQKEHPRTRPCSYASKRRTTLRNVLARHGLLREAQ